ncbi:DNA pilot protein [Tortoise microvirus 56]|nr:DNA pilot protein [Tortoise microvirus 56]
MGEFDYVGAAEQVNSSVAQLNSVVDAEKSRQQAQEQFDDSLKFQQQMWEQNNEYNTPLAQRERFEEAGYNPYLMAGQIQTGNATTMPDDANAINARNNVMQQYYQRQQLSQQLQMNNSQILLNHAQAEKTRAEAAKISGVDTQNVVADIKLKEALTSESGLKQIGQKLENEFRDMHNSNYAQLGFKQMLQDLENSATTQLMIQASIGLTNEQKRRVASEIAVNYAHAHNLDVQSENIQALQSYIIENMESETSLNKSQTNNENWDSKWNRWEYDNRDFERDFNYMERGGRLTFDAIDAGSQLYDEITSRRGGRTVGGFNSPKSTTWRRLGRFGSKVGRFAKSKVVPI